MSPKHETRPAKGRARAFTAHSTELKGSASEYGHRKIARAQEVLRTGILLVRNTGIQSCRLPHYCIALIRNPLKSYIWGKGYFSPDDRRLWEWLYADAPTRGPMPQHAAEHDPICTSEECAYCEALAADQLWFPGWELDTPHE